MKNISHIVLAVTAILAMSCDSLEKEVDVDIDHTPQFVVQAYVQNGEVPKVILSKSTSFESPIAESLELVTDADVSLILPGNDTIELESGIFFDDVAFFGFNYSSDDILNVEENSPIQLLIQTIEGDELTAQTVIPSPIHLDSIVLDYDGEKNRFTSYLKDNPGFGDFYRNVSLQILQDTLFNEDFENNVYNDFWFDDDLLNGESFPFEITLFEFELDDTLILLTSRLTEDHYDYLTSIDNARSANGSPFGQAGPIDGNINGGLGIFTGLSIARDTAVALNLDTTIVLGN